MKRQTCVGISGVFGHIDGRFIELGATLVTANGYGFQRLLFSFRILHQLFNQVLYSNIYCTVVPTNQRSIDGIKRSGLVDWEDIDAELLEEKRRISEKQGRSSDVKYFVLPTDEDSLNLLVRQHSANLLRWKDEVQQHREKLRLAQVRLDVEPVITYEFVLQQLAHGEVNFTDLAT